MRIVQLRLRGYKRLALRGITYFEYTPVQDMQLILGTNGSGKSSIMREMSPLPANPADYFKDGSKDIIIEHRGIQYQLISTFNPKAEHRFIVNGENLNKGCTITVQRELVKQTFGLDADLFNVMIDAVVFTAMPALKRRDWIIQLSGNDMTFALRVWQQLKSRLRDAQGVLKHLSKRLADETQVLPNPEVVAEMRATCDRLKHELSQLMQTKYPDVKTLSVLEREIAAFNTNAIQLAKQSLKSFAKLQQHESFHLITEIDSHIESQRLVLGAKEATLTAHQNEYASFADIIRALEMSNNIGVDELAFKVDMAWQSVAELAATLSPEFIALTEADCLPTFVSACNQLMYMLEETTDNQFTRFTDSERQTVMEAITLITTRMNTLQQDINGLSHARQHLIAAEQVTCPRCSLQFVAAYKDLTLPIIEERLAVIQGQYNTYAIDLADRRQYIEDHQAYAKFLSRLNGIFVKYEQFDSFWFDFKQRWRANPIPTVACQWLQQWINEAGRGVDYTKAKAYIDENEPMLNILRQQSVDGADGITRRIAVIESAIVHVGSEIQTVRTEIAALQVLKRQYTGIMEQRRVMEQTIVSLGHTFDAYLKAMHNDDIDCSIADRMTQLASTEALFLKSARALSVIEDLTRSKDETQLNLDAFTALVQELSPTEGLIAEQINAFMSSFVGAINQIIARIWTYDLQVLPCSLTDGELDYEFPLSVNLHALTVPDVSKGSSSQVDIVNFAFKIVVMMFLDMQDYPLYLDELAPSLDEQHRLNIIMFVKDFLEMRSASQLFMISHYAAMHGAFAQTDICVMDSTNVISLPAHFNQTVVIERG